MADDTIRVEVVYGLPHRQKLISLQVAPGTTMYQAARESGITNFFPGLELDRAQMGIFGKLEANPRERVLEDGDRVEIYRPLKVDPKDVRKARAAKAKAAKDTDAG